MSHKSHSPRPARGRGRPPPVAPRFGNAVQHAPGPPIDTWQAPKGASLKNLYSIVTTVAHETKAHIRFQERGNTFEFWGGTNDVANAKALLEANIAANNPSYKRQERQQGSDPEATFESMGYFVWPVEDFPPQQVLGRFGFGRLNQIRRECSCAIEYDAIKSSFKVMGDMQNVQDALVRVRGTLFQEVANQLSTSRYYFLLNATCQEVRLKNYPHPRVLRSTNREVAGNGRTCEGINTVPLDPEEVLATAKEIKSRVMQILSKIRYYRGNVSMRAHLGTLTLKQFQSKSMSLSDYRDMMGTPTLEARVTEEIGNKDFEDQVLSRMQDASDFLRPEDHFVQQLPDVDPLYTATITMNLDGVGDLQIVKSWKEDNGQFNVAVPAKFNKVNRDSALFEACLTDLQDALTWQIGISSTSLIDEGKLPTWVLGLAEYYIKLNPDNLRAGKQWCEFEKNEHGNPKPVIGKKFLNQRIAWTFEIQGSDYVVEVAKVQNIKYTQGGAYGNEHSTIYEPRLEVNVLNRQWIRSFAENEDLEVGNGASWRADIKTFFPASSEEEKGHVEMLKILRRVQDIVTGREG